jgi:hypothetical protein
MKTAKFLIIIPLCLGFIACERSTLESNLVSAEDNANAENAFNVIFQEVDEAVKEKESQQKFAGADTCRIITVSDTAFPRTITIDYQNGCTNIVNGTSITKKGKIIINQTAPYKQVGSELTITLEDFFINDVQLTGSKSIKNNGRNSANNLTYTVNVEGGKVLSDGKTTTWTSTRTNEWKSGESTPFNIFDDVYSITGSASGINKKDENYTVTINDALIKKIGCRWITEGTLTVKVEGKDELNLDYGDGDNKATVTFKGKTKEITLRR